MASALSFSKFDFNTLGNQLLRRQNVARMVRYSRWGLIAITVFAPLLAIYFFLDTLLTSKNSALKLENVVQNIIDTVNSQSSSPVIEDQTAVIAQRNMFGTLGAPVQPTAAATPPPPTQLSLILIGTFISKGQEPYAIIEDKKKQNQDVFLINQSVFGQADLKRIFEDRVEIMRDGKLEVLKLDDLGGDQAPASGISSDGDEFVVAEAEIDKGLENLPLLLTQARAVPYFKDGRAIGLRLFAIKNDSLYEKLGLKNGDILKSINGNSLGDLSQALKLFEQLKQERSISLTLERDRGDREFKYSIR